MSNLREVPTDELLSFHDFEPVHHPIDISTTTIPISVETKPGYPLEEPNEDVLNSETNQETKLFWTLKYYQKFFDVDTADVRVRLLSSMAPSRNNILSTLIKKNPDLYGPFWVSVTLIFVIAISGNISNYLQHANVKYHWKYDFHLVSYAATAIVSYVTLVPMCFWGLLRWSSDKNELKEAENNLMENNIISSPLEFICIYGYSLFVFIPAAILLFIQIELLKWFLVLIAALLSGVVLVMSLLPSLKLSKHKYFLIAGVAGCHLLLAVGFMMYFFHVHSTLIEPTTVAPSPSVPVIPANVTSLPIKPSVKL